MCINAHQMGTWACPHTTEPDWCCRDLSIHTAHMSMLKCVCTAFSMHSAIRHQPQAQNNQAQMWTQTAPGHSHSTGDTPDCKSTLGPPVSTSGTQPRMTRAECSGEQRQSFLWRLGLPLPTVTNTAALGAQLHKCTRVSSEAPRPFS